MNKGGKEGAEKLQKDDVHYEVKATPKRLILLSHRPFQLHNLDYIRLMCSILLVL